MRDAACPLSTRWEGGRGRTWAGEVALARVEDDHVVAALDHDAGGAPRGDVAQHREAHLRARNIAYVTALDVLALSERRSDGAGAEGAVLAEVGWLSTSSMLAPGKGPTGSGAKILPQTECCGVRCE